jgi:hypothetical protein
LDYDIDRAKELIKMRDEIDTELAEIFSATPRVGSARKPQKCGKCGKEGHSARTCPDTAGDQTS